jgi:hypothetical protein
MKQSNPYNQLRRSFNHRDNHSIVCANLERITRNHLYAKDPIGGDSFLYAYTKNRRFAYMQFVYNRHELATVQGCPLSALSDETLYDLLMSGDYSWIELEAMNDDVEREMMVEINSQEEE